MAKPTETAAVKPPIYLHDIIAPEVLQAIEDGLAALMARKTASLKKPRT